jgi:hypothetical protein
MKPTSAFYRQNNINNPCGFHAFMANMFLKNGSLSRGIPRATKLLIGIPSPPSLTPMDYADLWKNAGAGVQIAEIKSTSQGDAPARAEANHYILRHNEWLTRLGFSTLDLADTNYLGRAGASVPGYIQGEPEAGIWKFDSSLIK